MAFFAVFDEWHGHPKAQIAGLHGRALWLEAGVMCAKERNTDGRVSALMSKMAGVVADCSMKKAVPALVESGLWHDHDTIRECDRCYQGEPLRNWDGTGDLDPGSFFFHDWWHYQLNAKGKHDSLADKADQRRRALLRNKRLCGAIRTRDMDLCRYCGCQAVFIEGRGGDRKSPNVATFDHVNPFDFGSDGGALSDGGNSLEKVVVACNRCNSEKGQRTPEQAGMVLLPPPRSTLGSNTDQSQTIPIVDPSEVSPRVTRDPGPALIPAWSDQPAGAGSGLVTPGGTPLRAVNGSAGRAS